MSGSGKNHAAARAVNARGGNGKKENGAADIVHDEAVELREHGVQRGAGAQLRHHFGVNPVGHQRGADAVAGNVANQQIQIAIVQRTDQAEIAADGTHRMIKSFHAHAAPHQRFRRKALLHARGELQIFLDFPVTLFEFLVYVAQFLFGALQIGNVSERDDGKLASIGILDGASADDDGQARAIFFRHHELETIMARVQARLALRVNEVRFFGHRVCTRPGRASDVSAGHLLEIGVRENNVLAIIGT